VELDKYCDDRELVRLGQLIEINNQPCIPFTLGHAKISPLASLYVEQFDISPVAAAEVDVAISKGNFRYQHLIDSLDLIFRVPINMKTLPLPSKPQQLATSAPSTAASPATSTFSARPLSSQPMISHQLPTVMTTATSPSIATDDRFRSTQMMSTASDEGSVLAFRGYRDRKNERGEKDSDDDSDDEGGEEDDNEQQQGSGPTFGYNGGRTGTTVMNNRDSEDYDPDQGNATYRSTVARSNRYFSALPSTTINNKEVLQQLLNDSSTSWVVPVSPALIAKEDDDNFPSTEIDSWHVQYLAATRGDWDESIGLRRLNEGIPDEIISAYLENNFTPVHLGNQPPSLHHFSSYSPLFSLFVLFFSFLASFLGNYRIILEFVNQGGLDPNQQDSSGDTPLHCACKRGHYQIVKYLMEECSSSPFVKNSNSIIPLQYALKGGYLKIVEYMMEYSPKRISPGLSLLFLSYFLTFFYFFLFSRSLVVFAICFLTFLHCFLGWKDELYGGTLLHWACLGKRIDLVDYLLLKQNIPVEAITSKVDDKTTCLHWACYNSSVEVIEYLIKHSLANVHMKSAQGWTCLHFATASGNVEKTIYLTDVVRLKLTDKDKFFKTPFDVAVGACAMFLQERKAKGFVTGSIAEKNRRKSAPNTKPPVSEENTDGNGNRKEEK
jgi:ankyrin repeat protein